jgi:nitrogen fixation protein NifU and related proteins
VNVDLQALYQRVILDHNRHPRNHRVIAHALTAERENRICGDRVTVYVDLATDVIRDISFQGSGCAIVTASASLMTESVIGRTVAETHAFTERFQRMVSGPPASPAEDLGVLTAFAGVRQFPTRIRCATLPWDALRAALALQKESQ